MRQVRAIGTQIRAASQFLLTILLDFAERIYPTRRTRILETDRREAFEHLHGVAFSDLTETVAFVLNEVKEVVKFKEDSIRVLEKVAASQLAVAGTFIAISGAINSVFSYEWPISFLVMSIAIGLSCLALWPRSDELPSPGAFNYAPTLHDPANTARIAAALCEAWIDYSLDLQLVAARKRKAVVAAWIFIFAGIAALYVQKIENATEYRQPSTYPVIWNWRTYMQNNDIQNNVTKPLEENSSLTVHESLIPTPAPRFDRLEEGYKPLGAAHCATPWQQSTYPEQYDKAERRGWGAAIARLLHLV